MRSTICTRPLRTCPLTLASLILYALCAPAACASRDGAGFDLSDASDVDAGGAPNAGVIGASAPSKDSGTGTGTGTDPASRDAGTTAPSRDAASAPTPDASELCAPLIDDMEHGDGSILSSCGRRGYWYAYNDGTAAALQVPSAGSSFLPAPIAGGRAGSVNAAHTTGSGFTSWGAGIAFDLNSAGGSATKVPYDATAYSAVTFWARTGGVSASLRVNVASTDTDPLGGVCAPSSKCNDHFGVTVNVTSTWQQVTLRFVDARQLGWGTPVTALAPSRLLAMQFQLPAGAPFDLWVDDVAFVP